MHHLAEHGSDGFVVAGTTGEASTLTDEEHLRLIELAVAERPQGKTVVAGHRHQRHARGRVPHRTRDRARRRRDARRHALLQPAEPRWASRATTKRSRGHRQADARSTTSPGARRRTCRPTCSPSWRRSSTSTASSRPTPTSCSRSTGWTLYAGDDATFARTLDLGGAGGILVASHIVGNEMRRMVDEPEQPRARSTRRCTTSTRRCS